ncbi:MAG: hypothetical protein QXG03_06560 [Halalkalicoccus sp.]
MDTTPLAWTGVAILSLSLLGVASGPPAAAVSDVSVSPDNAAPGATAAAAADADRCFPGDGHGFAIGDDPRIDVTLHLSLLSNLGGPGGFGIELVGSTGGEEIIALQTGVRFDGIEGLGAFLSAPFEPFSLVFEYTLELPMFSEATGEDVRYDAEDAPVSGPVDAADC